MIFHVRLPARPNIILNPWDDINSKHPGFDARRDRRGETVEAKRLETYFRMAEAAAKAVASP